jgi:branched-chain amino acid transport system ATP-binding protein
MGTPPTHLDRSCAVTGILTVEGLTKRFFGLTVLHEVSFSVNEGELLSIIGPNGSGKTTLFNIVTGFLRPEHGRVRFRSTDITHWPPHAIARHGIVRTFQDVRLFAGLSALDNLRLAVQQHQEEDLLGRFLWSPKVRRLEREATERANGLLQEFGLSRQCNVPAGLLSYGQRKLLEFAIAIMPEPDVVLLDEPASAVNPTMINTLKDHVVAYNRAGHTVVLIEHNMGVVMDISDRILVLDSGRLIAEGSPDVVREDPLVLEAYFGR